MIDKNRKKVYPIRFYRLHDLDLVTFIEFHEFDIMRAIYSVLSAFSKGELFVIDVPPLRPKKIELKKIYRRLLVLDREKDADVIEMLDKVSDGYRNNFFKNLLRLYLCIPICEDFLNNENDKIFFDEKLLIFRDSKKPVKAGKTRKRYERKNNKKIEDTSIIENSKIIEAESRGHKIEKDTANNRSDNKDSIEIIEPPSLESLFLSNDDEQSNNADDITAMFGEMIGLH